MKRSWWIWTAITAAAFLVCVVAAAAEGEWLRAFAWAVGGCWCGIAKGWEWTARQEHDTQPAQLLPAVVGEQWERLYRGTLEQVQEQLRREGRL